MEPLPILILALATWRCASFVANLEAGPFDIFHQIRSKAGVRYDENSIPYGTNWISKGMLCVWCFSVWTGLFWTLMYFFLGETAIWIAFPFALSALSIIMDGHVDYG